jgi:hypothetical protein
VPFKTVLRKYSGYHASTERPVRYPGMKSAFQTKTLEELHAAMVKMSDAQLTEHGKMLRSFCRPIRGKGIDRGWLMQLNEARAEWKRRHPSKPVLEGK